MSLEDDILIEQFLKEELSEKERQSFMERLSSDASFREYFLMEKQLFYSLNEESWSFLKNSNAQEVEEYESVFKSAETQQLKQLILEAQESYTKSQNPKKNWLFYVAAAAVITLFSVLLFNGNKQTHDELFASYLEKTDLLALVDRGGNDSIFSLAQVSFNKKNYTKVIHLLSPVLDSTKNSNVYLYLAISDIEIGAFSEAEGILNRLINSDLLDGQKGYWYKSLLYLKSNQLEKSKQELQLIIDSSYYKSRDALQLLKQLN